MIDRASSQPPAGLRLGRKVIHQLRASLERDAGLQAATHLQEAGFAGGEELYGAFAVWLKAERNVDPPSDLDVQFLGEVLSDFFAEQGWGKLNDTTIMGVSAEPGKTQVAGSATFGTTPKTFEALVLKQPDGSYKVSGLNFK